MALRRFLLVLGLLVALVVRPHVAHAAGCCGSGHGLGQRLNRGERAAITASLRFADRFGSNDMAARFVTIPAGVFDGEGRAELAGIFAPVPRLQLGLTLPLLLNVRRFTRDFAVGGGLGDVSASARVDLVPLATSSVWPGIALTAAFTLPTGRSATDARDALAVDATGLGVVEFRPGIFVEKSFSGHASAILSGSVGLRAPSNDGRGEAVQLGPRWRLVAAAGPVFDNALSLSMGLVHERESAPSIGGVTSAGADRYRTAALGFVGYDLSVRFTLLGSVEVDLPLDVVSKNEPALVALSIGLRRSFALEN